MHRILRDLARGSRISPHEKARAGTKTSEGLARTFEARVQASLDHLTPAAKPPQTRPGA